MIIHHYEMHSIDSYKRLPRFVVAFHLTSKVAAQEIRRWCYNTYGVPGIRVDTDEIRWRDDVLNGEIIFLLEEDLSMFLLKWST